MQESFSFIKSVGDNDEVWDIANDPLLEKELAERTKPIKVDFAFFDQLNNQGSIKFQDMQLFDDLSVSGVITPSTDWDESTKSYEGALSGELSGQVIFVVGNARIRVGDEVRRTRVLQAKFYLDNGSLIYVRRILGNWYAVSLYKDTEAECAAINGEMGPDEQELPMPTDLFNLEDEPITVGVFYTKKAREGALSVGEMQLYIRLLESEMNLALCNSAIKHRIKVTYMAESTIDEGSQTYAQLLMKMKDNPGTEFGNFRTDRINNQCDLGVLIIEKPTSAGGAAFTMCQGWNIPNFKHRAFSCMNRLSAQSTRTFPHELAHNMGCADLSPACTKLYTYCAPHNFAVGGKTKHTLIDPISDGGEKILYFSNPSVLYSGVYTGVEATNHAECIRQTANLIKSFY